MEHTGILTLSQPAPLPSLASDGTFQLTLHAVDRLSPRQSESWMVVFSGEAAKEFWATHCMQLKPGQPIRIWSEFVMAMANPLPYIYAKCSNVLFVPTGKKAAALLAEMDAA
jgi:hypothetical protein